MPRLVRFQQLGNVGDKRIVGVRIGEERTNTEQHLAYGESWTPLVLENIKTNTPIGVDVAMVDACSEVNLGGLEWVVSREVNV